MLKRHLESTRFLDDEMAKTTSGQSDFLPWKAKVLRYFCTFFYHLSNHFFIHLLTAFLSTLKSIWKSNLTPQATKRMQNKPKNNSIDFKAPNTEFFKNHQKTHSFLIFLKPERSHIILQRPLRKPKKHPKKSNIQTKAFHNYAQSLTISKPIFNVFWTHN